LSAVVLAELGVTGRGLAVVIQLRVVVGIKIGSRCGGLGIAEGQGCEGSFHGSIVRRTQPLCTQPILVLEVSGTALVEGHRRGIPVILPLHLSLTGSIPIPCRNPLARRIEGKIRGCATNYGAHPLVQRVVEVGRRQAAIHCENIAIGLRGPLIAIQLR